jgi:hypothetical protein
LAEAEQEQAAAEAALEQVAVRVQETLAEQLALASEQACPKERDHSLILSILEQQLVEVLVVLGAEMLQVVVRSQIPIAKA